MRWILATLLAIAAGVLVSSGVAAGDARATLLDDDRWVDVTAPVVQDPVVRDELAGMLVEGVAARLACRGTIAAVIVGSGVGDKAKALLRGKVEDALATEQVERAWMQTNRTAHREFVRAVRLDRDPGQDRLLDVAGLLDAIGARIDGEPAGARGGAQDACAATDDPGVQLVDPAVVSRAADAARVIHRTRSMPELLIIGGVLALLLSLACARPVTTLVMGGGAAAVLGIGWYGSRQGITDAIARQVGEADGRATATAIAEAALQPAFEHQLLVGVGGLAVVAAGVAAAVIRRSRRARPTSH